MKLKSHSLLLACLGSLSFGYLDSSYANAQVVPVVTAFDQSTSTSPTSPSDWQFIVRNGEEATFATWRSTFDTILSLFDSNFNYIIDDDDSLKSVIYTASQGLVPGLTGAGDITCGVSPQGTRADFTYCSSIVWENNTGEDQLVNLRLYSYEQGDGCEVYEEGVLSEEEVACVNEEENEIIDDAQLFAVNAQLLPLLLQLLQAEPVSELDFAAGYGYATYLSQNLEFLNNNARQVRSLIGKGEQLGWKMFENGESSFSIVGLSEVTGGTLNGSYYNVGSVNNSVGIEYKINDTWSVGAAYGYGTNWMDGKNDFDDRSSVNSEVNTGSIFGQYLTGSDIKIQTLFSYSAIENDGMRYFDDEKNTSDYGAIGYSFSLAAKKDFFLNFNYNNQKPPSGVKVTPLLGFTGNFYDQDGFTEDDGVITAKSKSTSSLMGEVGVELAALIPMGGNSYASPKLNASYEHNFVSGGSNSQLSLYDDITSVTTEGINYGNSRGRFGGGVDFSIDDRVIISLNGAYTTFGTGDSFSYGGGVTYKF